MKHFEITIDVRDARAAQDLLNDCRGLRDFLSQEATNVWCDDYDENIGDLTAEEEDLCSESIMSIYDDIKTILEEQGIGFSSRIWNED